MDIGTWWGILVFFLMGYAAGHAHARRKFGVATTKNTCRPHHVVGSRTSNYVPNEKRDIVWGCDSCTLEAARLPMIDHLVGSGHSGMARLHELTQCTPNEKRDIHPIYAIWQCGACHFRGAGPAMVSHVLESEHAEPEPFLVGSNRVTSIIKNRTHELRAVDENLAPKREKGPR